MLNPRTMGVKMTVSCSRLLALLALLAALVPSGASAKPGFGEKVDAYCSGLGRGTPFADLAGQSFLSECSLCHQFTYPPELPDKRNTFDPPAAAYLANNLAYFCPAVTNQPPAITPIADRSANVGEMLVIDVSASDPDGDPLVLSVANAPAGSSFVDHQNGSATFTWAPVTGDVGSHGIDFLAHDDAVPPGQALESVQIQVGDSNRPPVLGAIGPRAGDPGFALEFTVSASDPDGDALQLSATPLPAGASFTDAGDGSGLFSWTPDTSQLGNHPVTFRVDDAGTPAASDSEVVTLTIGQVNAPPVLTPIGSRSGKVGEALTIALAAQDPDGNALAFSATGLPVGASLTDTGDGTASLSWLPAAGDVGLYDVVVSVADDGVPPESDAESLTITVTATTPPGVVRVDEARWQSGKHGGRLRVRGSGANPHEMVGVLPADSELVLGSKRSDRRGGFKLKLRPVIAPCAVQVQAGDVRSAAVPVANAPADCGADVQIEVDARWKCTQSEPGETDDDAGLRVRGERAPAGAAVEVHHGASHALLAKTKADARGRFRARNPNVTAPTSVDVAVSAGGLEWTLEAVPVEIDACDDDHEAEDPE
jgi:hypothetical protein